MSEHRKSIMAGLRVVISFSRTLEDRADGSHKFLKYTGVTPSAPVRSSRRLISLSQVRPYPVLRVLRSLILVVVPGSMEPSGRPLAVFLRRGARRSAGVLFRGLARPIMSQ
jgi:hypothetical protein